MCGELDDWGGGYDDGHNTSSCEQGVVVYFFLDVLHFGNGQSSCLARIMPDDVSDVSHSGDCGHLGRCSTC